MSEFLTPGDMLKDEFIEPLGLNAARLAKDIGVPRNRITEIIHGKRAITADTAMRFERYFGLPSKFWMQLQMNYELKVARATFGDSISAEVKPHRADGCAAVDTVTN